MNPTLVDRYAEISTRTASAGEQAGIAAWGWNAARMREEAQKILRLADEMERCNRLAQVATICSAVKP